jgi:subtilisin-like proprotein convertase family protein
VAIPDNNPTGLETAVAVPTAGALTSIRVRVNISHTAIGNLEVSIQAPDGTRVLLHNRTEAGTDNLITTYPDPTPPAQSLAVLNGKAIAGTWKLRVRDLAAGDVGRLDSWTLTLGCTQQQVAGRALTSSTGAYTIGNLAAGSYTVVAAKSGYTLLPSGFTNPVTVGPSKTGINFAATANTVTGLVRTSSGALVSGVVVTARNTATGATFTAPATTTSGRYTVSLLPAGNYTLTAAKSGFTFAAQFRQPVPVPSTGDRNFTATPPPGVVD